MPALVEHLRARLGKRAVYGIERVAEHRPENAWRVAEPALPAASAPPPDAPASSGGCVRRPVWLLADPEELPLRGGRPSRRGALELLSGPERIESGWWDGGDVARDYYVASDKRGSLLWIYHELAAPRRWFLHGIFG